MFLKELHSLEKSLYAYVQKTELFETEKSILNQRIDELEAENETLKKKLSDLQNNGFTSNSDFDYGSAFEIENSEALKGKIMELVGKIDYHLRS